MKSTPSFTTQNIQTAESIQNWLIDQLAQRINVDPDDIDIQVPFESFALESAEALVLLSKLEHWIGRPVPPVLIWNYPTIELLSQRLAEDDAEGN
jgi:acyl carrier protein